MSRDLRFKHLLTCNISGHSGSGMSSFCIKLLQNFESLSTETRFDGGVLWCNGETNAVPSVDVGRRIQFHEVVPDNFANVGNKPCLIIVDDLLNEAFSKELCHLFTKGSPYRNISVILITQYLFHQAKHCRDISLNAKYIVLLKNTRDKYQFTHQGRQVYPKDSASLYKAYHVASDKPHGYLVLDFSQDTNDRLRFRTIIFPDEGPHAFYTP